MKVIAIISILFLWIVPMFTLKARRLGNFRVFSQVSSISVRGNLQKSNFLYPKPATAIYRVTSLFSTEQAVPVPVQPPSTTDTVSATTTAPAAGSVKSPELEVLEIRVGKIVEIGKHPEADSLYVEKVDVGEPTGPRTIVSGLVNFCTAESLLNRKVIVLCNLKPRPLKGITSHGMLLCASNADKTKVEPLTPADSTNIGELIQFSGHTISPAEPGNKATKAFGKIADDFFVNDDMQATFRNIPFQTSAGPIQTNLKGKIS